MRHNQYESQVISNVHLNIEEKHHGRYNEEDKHAHIRIRKITDCKTD